MLEYFDEAKTRIIAALEREMRSYGLEYAAVSGELGADAAARLVEFSLRGKMIRGSLVRLGYELAAGQSAEDGGAEYGDAEAVALAGAAMELFQSGLLAHDDIMDRDRVRRGKPTLHVGYEAELNDGSYADPAHHGEALGICSGDLAYFAAFRMLSALPLGDERARQVAGLAARELGRVVIAQMQDVVNGAARPDSENPFGGNPTEPSEADILRLYRFKTGRYTFSLPLAIGAAIAGAPARVREALEAAGESLGLLFQLKDDELGLYADPALLGKPVGTDIRENKKTIFRYRLFARADAAARSRLDAIFGYPASGEAELAYVRAELERLGIRDELTGMMRDCASSAGEALSELIPYAPASTAAAYRELVSFSLERRS